MIKTDLIVLPDYSPKLVEELRRQQSKLMIGWDEYDLIQAIDSDFGNQFDHSVVLTHDKGSIECGLDFPIRRDFYFSGHEFEQLSFFEKKKIIFNEIVPNLASLLLSTFVGTTIYAIGAQVGLEFLGLGDVGLVTWGTNLYWASNDQALLTQAWWTFVPTGLGVAFVGFALAMINFGIDEITNPRLGVERSWKDTLKKQGVVIGEKPLIEIIPLTREPKENLTVVQFDKDASEAIGLLKMDFLGLKNLTVIYEACDLIKRNHKISIDPEKLSLNDQKVFDLLAKGDTIGIFQCESPGMRETLRQVVPDCIQDVIAVIAFYRP